MTDHKVVGRAEWQAAREELLRREKEHTRMGDELSRVPDRLYPILERTPKGRDEGDGWQLWLRRHDEYGSE